MTKLPSEIAQDLSIYLANGLGLQNVTRLNLLLVGWLLSNNVILVEKEEE